MTKDIQDTAISHEVVRLDISTQQSYDDFIRRFETVVPMLNQKQVVELVERKAPWSEVAAHVAASAPHDFLLYWKLDLAPLMSLAGNKRRATEYLMGNHVIAETMYRHDPAVGLYVPFRCLIYEAEGGTRFAINQPSAVLSSLGHDQIAQVGKDLDRKLARLLTALDLKVPSLLSGARAAGPS